jgi:hypothetical protein
VILFRCRQVNVRVPRIAQASVIGSLNADAVLGTKVDPGPRRLDSPHPPATIIVWHALVRKVAWADEVLRNIVETDRTHGNGQAHLPFSLEAPLFESSARHRGVVSSNILGATSLVQPMVGGRRTQRLYGLVRTKRALVTRG